MITILILASLFAIYIYTGTYEQNNHANFLFVLISTIAFNIFLKKAFEQLYKVFPQIEYVLGKGERPRKSRYADVFDKAFENKPSFGMPSGHAQLYALIATVLLSKTSNNNNKLIQFTIIALALIGSLMRIVYQKHHLNQVIVGALIGIAIGYISHTIKII